MNEAISVATREAQAIACPDCGMFQLCVSVDRAEPDLALLDRIVKRRRELRRGEHLFRPGEPFLFIYAVRSGTLKTYAPVPGGRDRITGFHVPGELLGLDAIDSEVHPSGARALEPTSVCELPLHRLEELGGVVNSVQRQMLRLMSRQLLHDQQLQAVICRKGAEERLAAFLLGLSQRYAQHGFASDTFRLSMTRAEIGDYLGIAKETVSRLFTRLEQQGLIRFERRQLRLLDRAGLAALADMPPLGVPGPRISEPAARG